MTASLLNGKHAVVITTVPGGVGPMTICMLLRNTLPLLAAEHSYQIEQQSRGLKK